MSSPTSLSSDILLWGAPSSGKTSLLRAFIKHLAILNSKKAHLFTYEPLDGRTGLPLFPNTAKPEPSPESEDQIVHLRRYLRSPMPEHFDFSQYRHELIVRDVKGEHSITFVKGSFDGGYGVSVEYFKNMLVTLDVNSKQPEEALQDFQRLATILKNEELKKKFLAICLTKKDQIKLDYKDPRALFDSVFSGHSHYFHNILKDSNIVHEFFATSAIGFDNFNSSTGWLRNEDAWHPDDAATPFFWLFTQVEKYFMERETRIWFKRRPKYLEWTVKKE